MATQEEIDKNYELALNDKDCAQAVPDIVLLNWVYDFLKVCEQSQFGMNTPGHLMHYIEMRGGVASAEHNLRRVIAWNIDNKDKIHEIE